MTTLSQLAIEATMDAGGFDRGMAVVKTASDKGTAAVEGFGAALTRTEQKLGTQATALDRLQRSVDPTFASQQKLAQGTATFQRALDNGTISAEKHADLLQLLNQRYAAAPQGAGAMVAAAGSVSAAVNDNTRAFGLSRIGLLELQAAGINSFQALASGMSPLRVATMEGAQAFGAFAQGGLGVSGILRAMISPIGLAVTAAAALGGGFALLVARSTETEAHLRSFNVIFNGLGTGTTTTALGLNRSSRACGTPGQRQIKPWPPSRPLRGRRESMPGPPQPCCRWPEISAPRMARISRRSHRR